MKKAIQKFIALFLVTVVLLNSVVIVGAVGQDITVNSPAMLQEDGINQYNLMLMAFKHAGTTRNATYSDLSYPDYYAGSYINEDNDLVVKLTKDSLDKASTIREMTRSNDTVIEAATYSYNELTELKDSIWNEYLTLYATYEKRVDEMDENLLLLLIAFVGIGINEESNCIEVSLRSIDDNILSSFKKYFSSSNNISFELCNGSEEQSNIYSGNTIYGDSGSAGSVGFRSRLSYNGAVYKGFFTAAHVIDYRGEYVTYTDNSFNTYNNVGIVIDAYKGGTLDAAFIAIDDDYEVVAATRFGVSLGDNYYTSLPKGSVVTMCGQASSTALSGEIKNTSYNLTMENGDALSDTYRCDYQGNFGDSGGVVYREISGSNCIVGIHAGKLGFWQGNNSYVIKASNIYAHWSLYLY